MEDFGKEEKNRPANGPFTVFYVCNLIKITITSPLIVAHLAQRCFLSIKREKMVYFYGGMPEAWEVHTTGWKCSKKVLFDCEQTKGQTKSKQFFQADVSSKERTTNSTLLP